MGRGRERAGPARGVLASALTKREQQQLNTLLRKLMVAFEVRESAQPEPAEAAPPSR